MKKTIADEFNATADLDEAVFVSGSAAGRTETADYFDEGDVFPLAAGGSAGTSAGSSSPVASIATLADWLINGFWQNQGALPHHWASNTITYNLGNLNAQEQALALSALNAWHEVANINFVQVTSGANISFNHNGTMQAVTYASWTGTGRMTSVTINISTDWITTDGGANDGKTGIDSYAYQTYIHEIGHALGLGHQGPYNGSANYSVDAIFANDTWQYSIMSYFPQSSYSGSYRYVITPQMADIHAVGVMYGASATTRTGDTVYGFNTTAGAIYNFASYSPSPALTIYDSGGNDTLDCSGYSNNQLIDLRAGNFSSVGGLVNNIGIALGVVIEKAVGGSGNDTLIANDAGCTLNGGAGADTLFGGAGVDRLVGGVGRDTMFGDGGADTFAFAAGDSSAASGEHDLISDFTAADIVDISALGTFRFLGTAAFDGGTYALNFFYNGLTGLTTLQGDSNGDKVADFAIDLAGNIAFTVSYVIGAVQPPPVVIESNGVTGLVQSTGNYFLNPVGGGTGLVLQFGGSTVSVGQFAGWSPIGAEVTASGYVVAWYNAGGDAYTFWYADSSGALLAIPPRPVAASDPVVQSFESSLHQDLNGDGAIAPPTVIEAFGVTSLLQSGSNYILGSAGPVMQFGGSVVWAGQFAGWAPVGAEATASGYEVAWYNAGINAYVFWHADSSGALLFSPSAPVAANDLVVQSFEGDLHQDLNGDGVIGPVTVIEAFGMTDLAQSGSNNYFLSPVGGGARPALQFGGSMVSVGQFAGWTPIGVEAIASGYQVAWYNAGADAYTFWYTDSSGALLFSPTGPLAANNPLVQSFESGFHQDLNGDGVIGPATLVEAFGMTSLVRSGTSYFLGSTGPVLKFGGSAAWAGQFAGWAPIGAEATASGYQVAWYNAGADAYAFWQADSSGILLPDLPGAVAANDPLVQSFESSFHQDLNRDGVVGHQPICLVSAFMGSEQSALAFDFCPDLGSQAPNLHALDDGMSDHIPVRSLADEIRSVIDVSLEHLPALAPDADNSVQKVLAVHSEQLLFH
jgi:serralysin